MLAELPTCVPFRVHVKVIGARPPTTTAFSVTTVRNPMAELGTPKALTVNGTPVVLITDWPTITASGLPAPVSQVAWPVVERNGLTRRNAGTQVDEDRVAGTRHE